MGLREAAFQGASAGSMPLTWKSLRPGSELFVRTRSLSLCSDAFLHPPFGACGMRIAAHFREAPARDGNGRPTEEVA